jgi:hypothetical protein
MSLDQLHALETDVDSFSSVGEALSFLSHWWCM